MKASRQTVKPSDTLICLIDEWGRGEKRAFDGYVTRVTAKGADVCYLSGYRSRNDHVPWGDVVAKVDNRRAWVDLREAVAPDVNYTGHFLVFSQPKAAKQASC